MSRLSKLDKFNDLMFSDISSITDMTEVERNQLLRYRFAFTILLENPSCSDVELRDNLMMQYEISQSQAYRDISNMKVILPNIRNAGKEWIRYVVNEELKCAIKLAKEAGKIKETILAVSALAKYNRLDQDDADEMPWDEIIPTGIEPTSDPSVLDITPLQDERAEIKRLYEKYTGEIELDALVYNTDPDERKEEDLFQPAST